MKIFALEEHFILEPLKVQLAGTPNLAPDPMLLNEHPAYLGGLRIREMDEDGIDVQVICLTTPGVQNLEPVEAVTLARQANDILATGVAAHPDRFEGFVALPTPDPAAAAAELRRAVDGQAAGGDDRPERFP